MIHKYKMWQMQNPDLSQSKLKTEGCCCIKVINEYINGFEHKVKSGRIELKIMSVVIYGTSNPQCPIPGSVQDLVWSTLVCGRCPCPGVELGNL